VTCGPVLLAVNAVAAVATVDILAQAKPKSASA
jgi:hypothetical protein